MLLPRKGCTFQRAGPRYHRIFVTSSALIKRKTRHSSNCLGVGRHFKLLCACANVATTWYCEVSSCQAFLLVTKLVDCQSEHLFSVRNWLLQLFMAQAVESRQIHLSSSMAAAVSIVSSEKISGNKKITETRQKTFPTNIKRCYAMPKSIQTRCRHGSMQ